MPFGVVRGASCRIKPYEVKLCPQADIVCCQARVELNLPVIRRSTYKLDIKQHERTGIPIGSFFDDAEYEDNF